ncbi:MAG: hypothetical protein CV087_24395 [Candidatus Brocadia sp. WS118]|nr:MAG: hypothetical protein CV087_24395 [Candidatus Brocadia sp. WS118]
MEFFLMVHNDSALNNSLSPQNNNTQLLENLTLFYKILGIVDKCDCCKARFLELKDSLND